MYIVRYEWGDSHNITSVTIATVTTYYCLAILYSIIMQMGERWGAEIELGYSIKLRTEYSRDGNKGCSFYSILFEAGAKKQHITTAITKLIV